MGYTATGTPAEGAGLQSAEIRAEFALIQAETDKLPTVAGNGGKLVAVNAGGTAMEATNTPALGTPASGVTDNLTTTTTAAAIADTDFVDTNLAAGGKRKILWTAVKTYISAWLDTLTATWSNKTFVAPVLGTPASGDLSSCTSNTETANNNSTQLASTAYADRLTAGTLPGAFTSLSVAPSNDSISPFVIYRGNSGSYLISAIGINAYDGNSNLDAIYNSGGVYGVLKFRSSNNGGAAFSTLGTWTTTSLAVTGSVASTTTSRTGGYTVATLPAGTTGDECYVTDATTPAWNTALVGGSTVVVGARKNTTVWVAF